MTKVLMKIREWLRAATEWLRCPSNTSIRRRIYFKVRETYQGVNIAELSRLSEMVINRPRQERRLLLKALELNPELIYLNSKDIEEIILFLK